MSSITDKMSRASEKHTPRDTGKRDQPSGSITERMSRASEKTAPRDKPAGNPRKGEHYRCQKCGMEVEVTADCRCREPEMVHFHCCGQELQQV